MPILCSSSRRSLPSKSEFLVLPTIVGLTISVIFSSSAVLIIGCYAPFMIIASVLSPHQPSFPTIIIRTRPHDRSVPQNAARMPSHQVPPPGAGGRSPSFFCPIRNTPPHRYRGSASTQQSCTTSLQSPSLPTRQSQSQKKKTIPLITSIDTQPPPPPEPPHRQLRLPKYRTETGTLLAHAL